MSKRYEITVSASFDALLAKIRTTEQRLARILSLMAIYQEELFEDGSGI